MEIINGVSCVGILKKECFQEILSHRFYKQLLICETLSIPKNKLDIEDIYSLIVKSKIVSCRVVETPLGKKVVIQGCILLKIMYTAKNPEQSVHTAHFKIPFCTFLACFSLQKCHSKDLNLCDNIHTFIEFVEVQKNSGRKIDVIVMPLITIKTDYCPPGQNHKLHCEILEDNFDDDDQGINYKEYEENLEEDTL